MKKISPETAWGCEPSIGVSMCTMPRALSAGGDLERRLGLTVEQSQVIRPGRPPAAMPPGAEIDRAHDRVVRQAGEEHRHAARPRRRASRRPLTPGCWRRRGRRRRARVVHDQRHAGLREVGRHGTAHRAEPDESDAVRHARPQLAGGLRSAQGRAVSKARAAWSTVRSAKRRPTICSPTGSPPGVKPAGTVVAGWPVKLNG